MILHYLFPCFLPVLPIVIQTQQGQGHIVSRSVAIARAFSSAGHIAGASCIFVDGVIGNDSQLDDDFVLTVCCAGC